MSEGPLLSLCVPTYNRADMLELMLRSLCPQVAGCGDAVELVISDNASSDRTPEVIAAAGLIVPITVHRNETNVGSRNFLVSVEHARGEYAWVLGDDDMVLPGRLQHVVETLRAHRDIDYFYVNYFTAPIGLRDRLILEGDTTYRPETARCVIRADDDRPLPSWEHIFDLPTQFASEVNTSILSSVFRRREWARCAGLLRFSGSPIVSAADKTLDDLFPHVKVLAHAMIGRPGYFIGEPCSLMGQGGQEWLSDWPAIAITGTSEALHLYARLGMERTRLRRVWRSHFRHAVEFMPLIGVRRDAPSMRDYDWGAYVWRNRRQADLLIAAVLRTLHPGTWLKDHLPAPVFGALRGAWRTALRARPGAGETGSRRA